MRYSWVTAAALIFASSLSLSRAFVMVLGGTLSIIRDQRSGLCRRVRGRSFWTITRDV